MHWLKHLVLLNAIFALGTVNCIGQTRMAGTYIYEDSDLLMKYRFVLKENGAYTLDLIGDRSAYSNGFVIRKGSSLILRDSIIEGFNIDVRESRDSSLTRIKINPPKYNYLDEERNAVFWPNSDSSKKCLITAEDCTYEMGSIKEFRLGVEGFASKIYHLKSRKSNLLDISIRADRPLFKYQAWIGYKILIVNSSTLKLFEDTEKGRALGFILLRKVK